MNQLLENQGILEKKCLHIMNFASGAYYSLYSPDVYLSQMNMIQKEKEEVDIYLLSLLKDGSILENQELSYTTVLYIIYYLENQIEEKTFVSLISYLLEKKQPEYFYFSPIVYLLQSESVLPPDVICKISKKIETDALEEDIEKHTEPPYDLGYFFLRREETPVDIKKKYLEIYDLMSYNKLKKSLESFIDDFNSDLCNHKITDISQIKGNRVLEWDYCYYQVMQEYVKKRNVNKKKMKSHKG